MLIKKRTKISRQRGSSGHGWGHKKKHRGAGHRGGKGLAGTGARGDQRKSAVLSGASSFLKIVSAQKGVTLKSLAKNYMHFGKKGFKSLHKVTNDVLSLNYIETNFDKMVDTGLILKEKTEFVFDATSAGYDKILGRGKFSKKVTIIVDQISEIAKQRVEEAGGKVILPAEDKIEKTPSEE
ncbi:MAG: uL15 family ribosomal protein [Candidatus Woesearchaeota archaeon]|jgi:large subunit ribosomal protein L15|nr:uL15 family ribosomal protein [Candidatus Woesearchaeota archaeon]